MLVIQIALTLEELLEDEAVARLTSGGSTRAAGFAHWSLDGTCETKTAACRLPLVVQTLPKVSERGDDCLWTGYPSGIDLLRYKWFEIHVTLAGVPCSAPWSWSSSRPSSRWHEEARGQGVMFGELNFRACKRLVAGGFAEIQGVKSSHAIGRGEYESILGCGRCDRKSANIGKIIWG